MSNVRPWDVHGEYDTHIREKRQRKPFQDPDVSGVRKEYLEHHTTKTDRNDVRVARTSDQQRDRIGHSANVSTDVDRIRDEEQPDQTVEHRRRVVAAHV